MLDSDVKKTDQFYSVIADLLDKLQKAQEHLRQATKTLTSVECLQKSVLENRENEKEEPAVVTTFVVNSLKTIQQNLSNANITKNQVNTLVDEYSDLNRYSQLVDIVKQ